MYLKICQKTMENLRVLKSNEQIYEAHKHIASNASNVCDENKSLWEFALTTNKVYVIQENFSKVNNKVFWKRHW